MALDWDGGCDAGTATSWDAGSMAAPLQAVGLELVRRGSRIHRTEVAWHLEARTKGAHRLWARTEGGQHIVSLGGQLRSLNEHLPTQLTC